jgi:transcriptional regulator with XRE-family HTH domain
MRSVRPRFGQSLRERRFDLGWTQARLAAVLGVRPSDVARWERDESLPPASTIRAAARALGASPELARSWLEEVGQAPALATAVREISVRLLTSPPAADPFQGSILGPKAIGSSIEPRQKTEPPGRPALIRPGVVFPGRSEAMVYSSAPLDSEAPAPSMGRMLLTSAALLALGAVLWWALGQLGSGLSGLF